MTVGFSIYGDNSGNSSSFSNSNPSTRALTTSKVTSLTDESWLANTWYNYSGLRNVIQEIINRTDWQQGNSISLITKGEGGVFGRKFVNSFESGSATAPVLNVTYTVTNSSPTPTPNAPTAPSSLSAKAISTSQIDLSWVDNSSNESGFYVERRTSTGSYSRIATLGANVTSYLIS